LGLEPYKPIVELGVLAVLKKRLGRLSKEIDEEKLRSLVEVYKRNIEKELGVKIHQKRIESREYQEFKRQFMPPHLTLYEKLCNLSEKIIKVKPDKKYEQVLQESINIAHLNTTPTGTTSLSYLAPIFVILVGSLISYALLQSIFFVFFFFLAGILMLRPLARLPEFIANNWRMKASNQMVLCIFYVVTYMRHTSNLENAIEFASEHLAPPLSLDLKKVLWDVETEKYSSIRESLDVYLQTWKKWNMEFVEAFHLIEGSLYEGSEDRRLNSLDKALDVILEETYEKMLHYAHNLQSPITMLHMLGIIMPILGLVILPLVVSFMEDVKWFHIATLYNLALPFIVYFMGRAILSKRPTGYGQTDISEDPHIKKYRDVIIKAGKTEIRINPLVFSIIIGGILFFIGITPLLWHAMGLEDIGFGEEELSSPCGKSFCLLEYRETKRGTEGPFGLGASLLSLAVTAAFGVGAGIFFRLRSKNVMKIRERAKKLELEFASALFQLGNRLGDGLPAEIAFQKVADVMEGTVSGNFFQLVSMNIKKLGMGIKSAIFDPVHGALVTYPSNVIESSMKVLAESIKKGPRIAAQALTNVSRYIKEIHRVNERLKDLMADIISSMTSQIKFLTPAIAGIVIGITSMVSNILGKLGSALPKITEGTSAPGTQMLEMFGSGIPTFYFQIIVGIYVVQITYVLTILANGIENGADKLNERHELGKNLIRSTLLYCLISGVVILLFNIIAGKILMSTLV
jgi:hypothetical protein